MRAQTRDEGVTDYRKVATVHRDGATIHVFEHPERGIFWLGHIPANSEGADR